LGAWVQELQRRAKSPFFDLKPLRHRNYLGKTAEISILFGWTTRSTFFLIAILVWISGRMISQQKVQQKTFFKEFART
jgi:hypothetical protein